MWDLGCRVWDSGFSVLWRFQGKPFGLFGFLPQVPKKLASSLYNSDWMERARKHSEQQPCSKKLTHGMRLSVTVRKHESDYSDLRTSTVV